MKRGHGTAKDAQLGTTATVQRARWYCSTAVNVLRVIIVQKILQCLRRTHVQLGSLTMKHRKHLCQTVSHVWLENTVARLAWQNQKVTVMQDISVLLAQTVRHLTSARMLTGAPQVSSALLGQPHLLLALKALTTQTLNVLV